MTENDVRDMCQRARVKVIGVECLGAIAVVRIETLKIDPKTATTNLHNAGAGGVTWAWNQGHEVLWITERESA